ncbi:MAG: glycosidase [Acholeplasmataceae bacterium]
MIHPYYARLNRDYERLIKRRNRIARDVYHGSYERFINPVLTADHIPLHWRFDLDSRTNPYFAERLGVNSVFNPGAIRYRDTYYLVARVEGNDRKSFFALASSKSPVDQFRFTGFPLRIEALSDDEVNHYDMRLTEHEDGFIYGIFCVEYRDPDADPSETNKAVARAGIVRTKDLSTWERLPNLKTPSKQQRNVVLHPEFVSGRYAFYTRPQDGFIEAGKGGGISLGYVRDIKNPVIEDETLVFGKKYHTVYEYKNGLGPPPIRTKKGFIHLAHGVRETAQGLRYVLYLFMTDLEQIDRVIARPGGYFMAPVNDERFGDVGNVLFSNGWIRNEKDEIFIYYASSDTRVHVAKTSVDRLLDYLIYTPQEVYRTNESVEQRISLIERNHKSFKNEV